MMKRLSISVFFLVFTLQIAFAENNSGIPKFNLLLNPDIQGGVLEFSSESVERFELSYSNSDSVVLRNYSGLPLKALQFRIVLNKDGRKLIFKSLSRGVSIPAPSFLLDYELHNNELQADGTLADVVSVVILGWNYNVLLPGKYHHIISINYSIADLESDSTSTSINLIDIIGATDEPIQNANIVKGIDETIYLRKSIPNEEDKILLLQNYPNPFNPSTSIQFNISQGSFTKLEVFNSIGEKVSILVTKTLTAGIHEYEWNAEGLPSGIYFSRLESGKFISTKKMILLK